MKHTLLFLISAAFLSSCARQNYQQMYDNYAYQIDSQVQNGSMSAAEGESLKLNYLNQVNYSAQLDASRRSQAFQNMASSLRNRKTRCHARPDYSGGFYTDCS